MAVNAPVRHGEGRARPSARAPLPLRRSRTGFVFTTVAAVLALVLIVFATSESTILVRTHTETARVLTVAGYLDNLQHDLPRAAYIASFRSLIAMEQHVSETDAYLPDVDAAFTESFLNGTVNGTAYAIMDDSTFTAFAQRFAAVAAQQGMVSTIAVENVTLAQNSPWTIAVHVDVAVSLADGAGTIAFNRTVAIDTAVPIQGVKDPLYTIGTAGRAPHPVLEANVTRPYITPANDTTGLQELVNGTLYVASPVAPDFLMRFAGNLSASPYGIESLVDTQELRAQGLAVDLCKSVVDYEYFGTAATNPSYSVVNMPTTDFWLADGDLATFDATGKTVGTVC